MYWGIGRFVFVFLLAPCSIAHADFPFEITQSLITLDYPADDEQETTLFADDLEIAFPIQNLAIYLYPTSEPKSLGAGFMLMDSLEVILSAGREENNNLIQRNIAASFIWTREGRFGLQEWSLSYNDYREEFGELSLQEQSINLGFLQFFELNSSVNLFTGVSASAPYKSIETNSLSYSVTLLGLQLIFD